MKKRQQPQSAFFDPRVFISFLLLFGAVLLVFGALGVSPATTAKAQGSQGGPQTASSQLKQSSFVPANLGNGLDRLVASDIALKEAAAHVDGAFHVHLGQR